MMMEDKGDMALPSERAGGRCPEPAAQSQPSALIPSAGDIVIIEHPHVYDRHTVARVVEAARVMWTINYRDRWSDSGWGHDKRRKIKSWLPAPANMTPSEIDEFLQHAADELRVAQKSAVARYHESIKSFAHGIEAGTGETGTGSAEGESAARIRDVACETCGGYGELFVHSSECESDYCALAGGIDDCNGEVVLCHCATPKDTPHE